MTDAKYNNLKWVPAELNALNGIMAGSVITEIDFIDFPNISGIDITLLNAKGESMIVQINSEDEQLYIMIARIEE